MKISDVINLAKVSELNTLAVKDNIPALINFINLGLLELYAEFNLYTEEALIELVEGTSIYDLPDNLMYITGAFEAPPEGSCLNANPLPINEEGNPYSVNTINFKQIQVPLTTTGAYISILYTPRPPEFLAADVSEELPLPNQLIQPLLLFMAAKGHGAIRTDGQSQGDVYFARFKRACDERKTQGVVIAADDLSMATRIGSRGFV
jgi:hypothetical protein